MQEPVVRWKQVRPNQLPENFAIFVRHILFSSLRCEISLLQNLSAIACVWRSP